MKLTIQRLRKIISEEVNRVLLEARDPVTLVRQFADEQGVDVEQVHALWGWYNGLISAGKWASDPDVRDSPQGKLFDKLMHSDVTSADIKASIDANTQNSTM